MTKLIWMSDLHFTKTGDVLGHNPRIRLQAAIDYINEHHHDAAHCIISGDMANRATPADYADLSDRLQTLEVPYLPMVGNHDNRDLFRKAFSLPETSMAEFIQYDVPTAGTTILCLDTHKPGSDAGSYCAGRMDWLRDKLNAAGDTPVLIFMHHPPMSLGLPMQDKDKLENGDAVLTVLSEFNCVKYLCIGHVHRAISGTIGGIGFATMPSVLFQAPPPLPEWTWDTFIPAAEPPSIGVIHVRDGSVTLHYEQICAAQHGVATA